MNPDSSAAGHAASNTGATHWSHGIPLSDLRTPAYVYCVDEAARRIRTLKTLLGTEVVLSFKACPSYDVVARLPPDCLGGVELASRGELHCFAGHRLKHLYVNTPALDAPLVRAAIASRASIVIDAPEQLHLVDKHRGKSPLEPTRLRLSNRLVQRFTPEAPGLRQDQFGMDLASLAKTVALARKLDIKVDGLHLFAGPHTFGRAARHVVAAIRAVVPIVEERLGHRLAWLSLGGGLEENWADKGHDFALYRRELESLPSHIEKVHEFGRAVFASAGVFATQVIATKVVEGQAYAICDGGMAQAFLLAQTENTFRKYRRPRIANRTGEPLSSGCKTIVVGSSCSRDDVIGETDESVEKGDVLMFEGCGAYHRTYSMNSFLSLGEATTYVY